MFAVAKALFAAVVLGGSSVLAADVPVFSANDDYDEVNLNIRLLAAHTNTTSTEPAATLSGSMETTLQVPDDTTADGLGKNKNFTDSVCKGLSTVTGVPESDCKVDNVAEKSRRGRALAKSMTLVIDFTLTLANEAAANALKATMAAGAGAAAFEASLVAALTQELSTAMGAGFTVTGVTSKGATVTVVTTAAPGATTAPTTAAPAAAPAASKKSSDATMLKTNVAVAAIAALVASAFW